MLVRSALALALAVPLLLAGCTDEPEPKMPDPTPSSSAPSPSPSESETAEVESAEEFIRRWVAVNTEMQNSGSVDEYASLSSKCNACIETAERVRKIYANGGFVRTEGWMLQKVTDRSGPRGGPILDLRIDSAPTTLKESSDAAEDSYPGGNIVMRARLSRNAPWQVIELTQVAS